jgi:hypothetical protein
MLFPGLKNGLLGSKSAAKIAIESTQVQCVTRQEAIDEAVRRFRRERPVLVELSLNPLHENVRQQVVDWVRTEYQRIMAEGTITAS